MTGSGQSTKPEAAPYDLMSAPTDIVGEQGIQVGGCASVSRQMKRRPGGVRDAATVGKIFATY
jgi:hypothetical protein